MERLTRASLCLIAFCCLAAQPLGRACANGLSGEWVRWHGRSYRLAEQPLSDRMPELRSATHFVALPTAREAAHQGYLAQWQLDDDRLYLQDVTAWVCADAAGKQDCRPVSIRSLFGAEAKAPWLADWFSGVLHLRLDRTSCGPADDCASLPGQVRLTMKSGKLTRIENIAEAASAAPASSR
ncbi:hypothetical protein [Dyella terrae]|nr:hypothetical protein [Dyella terrae]TBR36345.1 hypothetical protein EYV96_17345 [Dyella terrae]